MKALKYFVSIAFLLCLFSCTEDSVTKHNDGEQILSIYHNLYKGECLGYCDTDLVIDSLTISFTQRGWNIDSSGNYYVLQQIDSNYYTNPLIWSRINEIINMDRVMTLDSTYYIDDDSSWVSEGYINLRIETNLRSKSIKFLVNKYLPPIDSLNKFLINLRDDL